MGWSCRRTYCFWFIYTLVCTVYFSSSLPVPTLLSEFGFGCSYSCLPCHYASRLYASCTCVLCLLQCLGNTYLPVGGVGLCCLHVLTHSARMPVCITFCHIALPCFVNTGFATQVCLVFSAGTVCSVILVYIILFVCHLSKIPSYHTNLLGQHLLPYCASTFLSSLSMADGFLAYDIGLYYHTSCIFP
jgi:hypothetical protein